jgi:hypothetical protein
MITFSEWMKQKRLNELAQVDQARMINTIAALYGTTGGVQPAANALALNAPTLVTAAADTAAGAKAKEINAKALAKNVGQNPQVNISPAAVQTSSS